MSVNSKEELELHIGHDLEVVSYSNKDEIVNVAIECKTCNEVLLDFD